jgi:hypothetical protein
LTDQRNRINSGGKFGVVPKWSKGTVCKTVIRQFKSGRRLQILHLIAPFLTLSGAIFLFLGCQDPQTPPPTDSPQGIPRWSTTEHIAWKGPNDAIHLNIALIFDTPNGPLDQIAGDDDVTTFLNDRFHPIFVHSSFGALDNGSGLIFISPKGQKLGGPLAPQNAEAWIQVSNQFIQGELIPSSEFSCGTLNTFFEDKHPVIQACSLSTKPVDNAAQ